MAGSNIDRFWNHVVKMINDGSLNCEFCGHPFAKDTSISWIIWHLSGEKDRGVAICGQVPKQVQEAAFLAMHGGNSRLKTIASSSNVNDHATSASPREQNIETENMGRDIGTVQTEVQGVEHGEGEERISSHAEAENDDILSMTGLRGDVLESKLRIEQAVQVLQQGNVAEDYIIKKEELIDYLIDEEIIQKMWSREAAFDKGHAMLDRLENVGLLQRIDGGRAVKMHDLVRDMCWKNWKSSDTNCWKS
uniref:Disease resistance protein winged helix domain-containing protein n=1 Tax=Salix viminalis TaxID=40686 RepID=A0A6N2M873_SALVM